MLRALNRWLLRRADRRLGPHLSRESGHRPDNDPDGGAGVLVPAGPRPRIGGAQARPPEVQTDDT